MHFKDYRIHNLNVNGQKEVVLVSDSLFIKVRGPFNGAEKVHKPIRLWRLPALPFTNLLSKKYYFITDAKIRLFNLLIFIETQMRWYIYVSRYYIFNLLFSLITIPLKITFYFWINKSGYVNYGQKGIYSQIQFPHCLFNMFHKHPFLQICIQGNLKGIQFSRLFNFSILYQELSSLLTYIYVRTIWKDGWKLPFRECVS